MTFQDCVRPMFQLIYHLARLMARPDITAPIASATSVEQVSDLMKAVELKLDAAAIKTLDDASAWQ
jgi:aryl-alcohol dehydrogenase-like predicted oxidoreductase